MRRVTSDDWQVWRRLRRRALGEAPEAFGSTLAEWSGAGDTEDRWRHRLDAVPVNLVADLDDVAVGMVSVTASENQQVEIISMWVAPEVRGQGVADALVAAAIGHARSQGANSLTLDVRSANARAISFYERAGFIDAGWATSQRHPQPERRMKLPLNRDPGPAAP